jgi:hypothetical protein
LQLWVEVKQGCGLSALTGAQHLLAYPGGHDLHDGPQSALVGCHQQTGQCALKRAGGLDGAQGLDGADEGLALSYDAVGEISSKQVCGLVYDVFSDGYRAPSLTPRRRSSRNFATSFVNLCG